MERRLRERSFSNWPKLVSISREAPRPDQLLTLQRAYREEPVMAVF